MATQEALAFDMYGTLVDPIRIWKQLERYIPAEAQRVSELWRQKQLEYSFRLTVMERYEDFEQITRKALDYALAVVGHKLENEKKDALLAQYNALELFADVEPGLQRLKAATVPMVVFSNGSPGMLEAIMNSAGLHRYIQGYVSVDAVKVYKPSPRTYQLAAERLGRPIEQVRLISSNPFDIIGAQSAGMQAAWINRSGAVFDTLGSPPKMIVKSLGELADALGVQA